MDNWVLAAVVGVAGGMVAAVAVRWQHLLYSQEDFRRGRLRGVRLRAAQSSLAVAGTAVTILAFRPEHYDAGPALVTALFGLALLVLASTDLERRLLPNRLMYPALLAAAALCWVWPDRSVADVWMGAGVAAAAGIGLFALGQVVGAWLHVSATPFGLGDVKLILLIGLLAGWPAFLSALFIGVIAAGVPALAMVLAGRSRRVFSYGPFLVVGVLLVLLFPGQFVSG